MTGVIFSGWREDPLQKIKSRKRLAYVPHTRLIPEGLQEKQSYPTFIGKELSKWFSQSFQAIYETSLQNLQTCKAETPEKETFGLNWPLNGPRLCKWGSECTCLARHMQPHFKFVYLRRYFRVLHTYIHVSNRCSPFAWVWKEENRKWACSLSTLKSDVVTRFWAHRGKPARKLDKIPENMRKGLDVFWGLLMKMTLLLTLQWKKAWFIIAQQRDEKDVANYRLQSA